MKSHFYSDFFPGFGQWSAVSLARGLGRTEVVAGADLGIQNLVEISRPRPQSHGKRIAENDGRMGTPQGGWFSTSSAPPGWD
jgi:3-methyladenine DNA glycosylase/8-oxoguanine DNA glycosylase